MRPGCTGDPAGAPSAFGLPHNPCRALPHPASLTLLTGDSSSFQPQPLLGHLFPTRHTEPLSQGTPFIKTRIRASPPNQWPRGLCPGVTLTFLPPQLSAFYEAGESDGGAGLGRSLLGETHVVSWCIGLNRILGRQGDAAHGDDHEDAHLKVA